MEHCCLRALQVSQDCRPPYKSSRLCLHTSSTAVSLRLLPLRTWSPALTLTGMQADQTGDRRYSLLSVSEVRAGTLWGSLIHLPKLRAKGQWYLLITRHCCGGGEGELRPYSRSKLSPRSHTTARWFWKRKTTEYLIVTLLEAYKTDPSSTLHIHPQPSCREEGRMGV